MSNKYILSQSDIKIKPSERFFECFNSSLGIRMSGRDNLYLNHLKDFAETSPTLNSCVNRQTQFLIGKTQASKLISKKLLKAIITDFSIFGGFALFVQYDGLGEVGRLTPIPFETIRLGEQGQGGLYTYCYYSPDWSEQTTINKKKVNKKDAKKYWMFTNDVDTRLRRMNEPNYGGGEVLYFSNTLSYPTEKYRAALSYVSAEIGVSNILYRDVRCSFMPSCALAIPRQSDGDNDEFQENLAKLQGDASSYKVLTIEFSSTDDKPEVLPLQQTDYVDRVLKTNETAKDAIVRCFGQEGFNRLEDGSLGFGSEAINEIYSFYNFQLETERLDIQETLQIVDPTFKFERIKYENL